MATYDEVESMAGATGLPIKDASELLGVPAPTLRSWERRYGLPTAARTVGGHRRYTLDALTQLRMMRDEIGAGRPAADSARRVRGLLDPTNSARARVDALLTRSRALDSAGIRGVLDRAHEQLGLAATLDDVVMPTMRQIGSLWEAGRCDVGQEHYTTEVVRGWLAKIITLSPPPTSERWVLLAVGPRDLHTLGLDALASLLRFHGIGCRLLGPRTTQLVLVTAASTSPVAAVVVVSHLSTQRRAAVESLVAVAETGCPTFFAGNAFLFVGARKGVPGTYLGETMAGAADLIRPVIG